jgi:PAS domain S-box-containing protein
MTRRSLRGRLVRLGFAMAATVLAVSILSTLALDRLGGAVGLILRENYASVVACQEMSEALERQDSAVLVISSGRADVGRPLLDRHRARFAAALDVEARNVTLPGEGDLVRALQDGYRDYLAAVDRVIASPVGQQSAGYFADAAPRFLAVKRSIAAIRDANQANMVGADREARRLAQRTRSISMLAAALALLLVGGLTLRFPRVVVDPIETFTDRARAIGEGRFEAKLALPDVDELRGLAEALNRMQDRLRLYRESSLGELLAARDLSRATVAAMTDPVIVFGSDGEILLANEAAEAVFGVGAGDREELRQSGIELPERIAAARDLVLERGGPVRPESLSEAMQRVDPRGHERFFLVRASPLQGEEGKGVVVVAEDVTRYRRIDALKSDVVATVSHELKTPLTSLRLATHMLLDEGGPLTEVQRELAATARDETERLQRTVDELLDLVKIEREAGALHRVPVDPTSLLREAERAHRAIAAERRVELVVEVELDGTVSLDREQILIVLANLVSNAVRHSAEGGVVRLFARREGAQLCLGVRDEGEGIAAEHLPHVFERHFTGAEPGQARGRHGLGLAIAREIAERHGGTLDVESELGVGSTFTLRLPA